jgi:1-acyl-sn-glycerol-3-phosphate acyltransferase
MRGEGDPTTAPLIAVAGNPPRVHDRFVVAFLVVLAPLVLVFIFLHVLWGVAAGSLLFPVLPTAARDALVKFWSRVALAALGIRLELHVAPGATPIDRSAGSLLLINHVSWADVFLVAAVTPARFVAKSEIARWPVIGRFAAGVGTIFVERGRRHAIKRVNDTAAQRLRNAQSVGIFPEGTTTDGSCLLRFHANLIQAGVDAQAPMIPLALQYVRDGQPTDAAAFVGDDTLMGSMWKILVTPRLTAHLHWLPTLDCAGATRQDIGRRARTAIAAALGLPERDDAMAAQSADDVEQALGPISAGSG